MNSMWYCPGHAERLQGKTANGDEINPLFEVGPKAGYNSNREPNPLPQHVQQKTFKLINERGLSIALVGKESMRQIEGLRSDTVP